MTTFRLDDSPTAEKPKMYFGKRSAIMYFGDNNQDYDEDQLSNNSVDPVRKQRQVQ